MMSVPLLLISCIILPIKNTFSSVFFRSTTAHCSNSLLRYAKHNNEKSFGFFSSSQVVFAIFSIIIFIQVVFSWFFWSTLNKERSCQMFWTNSLCLNWARLCVHFIMPVSLILFWYGVLLASRCFLGSEIWPEMSESDRFNGESNWWQQICGL